MSTYQAFFSLTLLHDFFHDSRFIHAQINAAPETTRLLDNLGLIIRQSPGKLMVTHDKSQQESLSLYASDDTNPLALSFIVSANDEYVYSYSDSFLSQKNTTLYFDNLDISTNKNSNLLHSSKRINQSNQISIDNENVTKITNTINTIIPPLAIITIHITSKNLSQFIDNPINSPEFIIHFSTRKTYWKYYLLSNRDASKFKISDNNNKFQFHHTGQVSLANNKHAETYISENRIPLLETYPFSIQLREQGEGESNLVIDQLPMATQSQFGHDVVANKKVMVSEIYVNYLQ